MKGFSDKIFNIRSNDEFNQLAMEIFLHQSDRNQVYKEFIDSPVTKGREVSIPNEIPFLPIRFFRDFKVISGEEKPELFFESSGTTGQIPSKHYLLSEHIYLKSFTTSFRLFYNDPGRMCILALLPSYLERSNSSLVYMMDRLIKMSDHPDSGFYLDNLADLHTVLQKRSRDGYPTILIGVSFALLDLAEQYAGKMGENVTIMETGGMKGRRKEIVRDELHSILKKAFGLSSIHSEYGMTELLSQAYSTGNGIFRCPAWMKVLCRDVYDPLTILPPGERGALNIIDLANIHSCSFIATDDLGVVHPDGSFEVSGRMDQAEVRGCNLMI